MKIGEHWFWLLLAVGTTLWYTTVTAYIAFKGAQDIRDMLKRLKAASPEARSQGAPRPAGGDTTDKRQ